MLVTIEMPKGTKYKYEYKHGDLVLDRVLSIPVPQNYGFIENTEAEDGDPVDVFVISDEPLTPGCVVNAHITHRYICTDGGVKDDKLIGVISGSLEPVLFELEQISDYLKNYKKGFVVEGFEKL